jgi:cellulose synthase operon protein C
MRRLNGKLFLILLAGVTVGGALVHGLHAYQVHRHSGMFLIAADRAEQAGHFEESADNLRRYLLLSPADVDVTARLANLLFQHRQDRQSQILYTQVLQQQPKNEEARRRLVDSSLRLGAYQDAKYHIETFLLKSHPQDGELNLKMGICQQALGDYPGAGKSFADAIRFAPDLTAAYARLASLLVDRFDNGKEALAVMTAMVKQNPKKADSYLLRAAFLQTHAGNPIVQTAVLGTSEMPAYERPRELMRRSLSDAKAALELAPQDAKALLFAAQSAISSERPEEARQFAEQALKISPTEAAAYMVLASSELRQNRQANAVSVLKSGLQATKDNPLLLLTLANLELDAKDISAAKPLIDRLRNIQAFAPVVRYLDARILIDESKWAEAEERLRSMSVDLTRWPQFQKESLFWLAHCEAERGRADLRIAAYRSALDIDPFWPPARMGLAEALRESGRVDEALLEYQRLLKLPNIPSRASIAGLQLAVAKNLSVPPTDRSWAAIEKQKDEVARHASEENRLLLNAQLAAAEGKGDESRQSLRAAIAVDPKNPTAWVSLLATEVRGEHWSDAEKLLGEMQKQFKDGVPYRLARAEYLFRHLGAKAKKELRSLAQAPPSYSPAERQQLASGLARAALEIRDFEQAERLCRLVADNDPANLQIRLVLFDLAQQAGQIKAMERALEEVRIIEKDGFYSTYGDAVKLFLEGKQKHDEHLLDQALTRADEARRQRPDWARATLLIAEIDDYRNRRDAAIEAYTAAMDLGEHDPRLVGRLVSLLYEQGNYPKAESIMRRLQDAKTPFTPELARLASHTSIQTGDVSRALELARQSAEHSKDVRDTIWLGQVLSISGRDDEAESKFKQATLNAPKFPGGWIELIQLYRKTGKTDQAKKVLAEAKTKIDTKETPLALAYACELLGLNGEAEKYYADAIKAAPNDTRIRQAMVEFQIKTGKVAEADALLQQLVAESKDKATLQWSRRKQAGLLINSATYQNRIKAAGLIDENLKESPDSDADLRMRALADAALGTSESRQKAIKQLELLAPRPGVLTADDRLLLAKLYWSAGQHPKAKDELRSLATQGRRSAEYALAYAEVLLEEKDDLSEAENWVRRVEELAPNQFGTVVVRARLLAKQGRLNEAFESLTKFIKDDTGDPRSRTLHRRLASARLEEIGNNLTKEGHRQEAEKSYKQAENWLLDVADNASQPTLLHILFLIRHERNLEAVAEIERLQQGKDLDTLAKACLAIAQVKTDEHEVLERAARVAEHLASVRPTAESWIALGALQDRAANYDGAEQSYRKALEIGSTRIDALNNLAYILALRKKDLNNARSLIDQAIKSGGPRGPLRDSLAMIELAAGNSDAALSEAEQAASEDPNPVHLFHLARLQMAKGDRKAAADSLKKARQLNLTSALLHPLERATLPELEAQLGAGAL